MVICFSNRMNLAIIQPKSLLHPMSRAQSQPVPNLQTREPFTVRVT
jgi:hypothetical protein